jgi:hypothetical protein
MLEYHPENLVSIWFTTYDIHHGQSGTGTDFSPSFFNFPLLIISDPLLCIHPSLPQEVCDSPDLQHSVTLLGFKLGASSLSRNFATTGQGG